VPVIVSDRLVKDGLLWLADWTIRGELAKTRWPGFRHLRRKYHVRQEGERNIVPLDQLTDAEIAAKCQTYRKAAAAYIEHADELERYASRRAAA
jgi:hypothetical protein